MPKFSIFSKTKIAIDCFFSDFLKFNLMSKDEKFSVTICMESVQNHFDTLKNTARMSKRSLECSSCLLRSIEQ